MCMKCIDIQEEEIMKPTPMWFTGLFFLTVPTLFLVFFLVGLIRKLGGICNALPSKGSQDK